MDKNVKIFPWNDAFNTGLTEIDEQHKRLVALLNELVNHLAHQFKSPTPDQVFEQLTQYIEYHFVAEETIWQHYFADDSANQDHRADHARFISDITKIKAELNNLSNTQVMENVLSYLTNWLAFHIVESDKLMAAIVLAMQRGSSFAEAKQHACSNEQLNDSIKALIKSVLGLHSEKEYIKIRIIRYLANCKEDGGMTTTGLQQLAKAAGVDQAEKIHVKKDLVQAIQQVTQETPCFRYNLSSHCSEEDCIWKDECKKMVAIWGYHLN